MEPFTLASTAVMALVPYLSIAGEGVAKKIGEDAVDGGEKLLGWLRAKLGARGQEALDDLAARPDSEDNQADLRKQIQKALEADPALAQQLEALVRTGGVTADSMVQDVSGAGAKAAQVKGWENTTTIS